MIGPLPRVFSVVLPVVVAACSSEPGPSAPPSVSPAATRLVFAVQPSSAATGASLVPAVQVTAEDASGNLTTAFSGSVTVAIAANPAGATLSGTTSVNAVNGVATFPNLSIQKPGTGYSLTASSGSLMGATSAPFAINTVLGFATLSASVLHTCGLTTGGAAYCWGANEVGRLGDGTTSDRLVPVPVAGGLHFSALSGDVWRTCGLTTEGTAYCWGSNFFGQLGAGTTTGPHLCYSPDWVEEGLAAALPCNPSPTLVSGGLPFAALSATSSQACGITTGDLAYCWGFNSYGQLGTGTTTGPCYASADSAAAVPSAPDWPCSPSPVEVSGALRFAALSVGGLHSCGLSTGGVAYCWGNNYYGQLGDGTTADRNVPVLVSEELHFAALSAGSYHTCGLTISGAAYCWGWNNFGQLGDGVSTDSKVPVLVSSGLRFAALSTLSWHTCGLTTSGEAYCWGGNGDGQLGDGTTTNRSVPTLVLGGLRFVALSAGHRHTCGVTTDGAYCWGANDYGQFGNATTTSSNVPVKAASPP